MNTTKTEDAIIRILEIRRTNAEKVYKKAIINGEKELIDNAKIKFLERIDALRAIHLVLRMHKTSEEMFNDT